MEPAHAAIAAFQEGGLEGHPSVKEMLEEAAGLREHQELFEITVSEFLPLTRCQVCLPCCLPKTHLQAVMALPAHDQRCVVASHIATLRLQMCDLTPCLLQPQHALAP